MLDKAAVAGKVELKFEQDEEEVHQLRLLFQLVRVPQRQDSIK
jgi:hypothetical protein